MTNLTINQEPHMTPLRQRMLEDMQLRNLAAETQRNYLHHITGLARFYMVSPTELISICYSFKWNYASVIPALLYMIKVEGLTKRYARNVAVDNISFEVSKLKSSASSAPTARPR